METIVAVMIPIIVMFFWFCLVQYDPFDIKKIVNRSRQEMPNFKNNIPENFNYVHFFDGTGIAINEKERKIFLLAKNSKGLIFNAEDVTITQNFIQHMWLKKETYENSGFYFRSYGENITYQIMVGTELEFKQVSLILKKFLNAENMFE